MKPISDKEFKATLIIFGILTLTVAIVALRVKVSG